MRRSTHVTTKVTKLSADQELEALNHLTTVPELPSTASAGGVHLGLNSDVRLVPLNTFKATLLKWQDSSAKHTDSTTPAYDIDGGTCYLSNDRLSGFRISDGELTCVFSVVRGRGDKLVSSAIELGATKLDHFECDKLSRLYLRHGFEVDTIEPNWGGSHLPAVIYRTYTKPLYT